MQLKPLLKDMLSDRTVTTSFFYILWLLFIFICASIFLGCATPKTKSAETAAQKYGLVLDCREYRYPDCGESVVKCFIRTPEGKHIDKTIFGFSCIKPDQDKQ